MKEGPLSVGSRSVAEFVGTALLVAMVIGSGIMAESLTYDSALALLLNQLATVLGLGVIILVALPLSGAHINPVVTLAMLARRRISGRDAGVYIAVQLVGSVAGVALAHVMFGRAVLEVSSQDRLSVGTFVGEIVATSGLIAVILFLVHREAESLLPLAVPAWIGSAYFFTSSTSFANPAVTLGRMFTDSFAGIAPLSGLGFLGAQILGGLIALALVIPVISQSKEKNLDR